MHNLNNEFGELKYEPAYLAASTMTGGSRTSFGHGANAQSGYMHYNHSKWMTSRDFQRILVRSELLDHI